MMRHREIPAGTVVCGFVCSDNIVDYQVKGTVALLICFQAGVELVLLLSLGWAIKDSFYGLPFSQLVPVHYGILKGDPRQLAAYVHRLVWSSCKRQLILRYPVVSIWKMRERNQRFPNHYYSHLAQYTKNNERGKETTSTYKPKQKTEGTSTGLAFPVAAGMDNRDSDGDLSKSRLRHSPNSVEKGWGRRAILVSELMKVLPSEMCHFIVFLVQRIYQVPDDVIKTPITAAVLVFSLGAIPPKPYPCQA